MKLLRGIESRDDGLVGILDKEEVRLSEPVPKIIFCTEPIGTICRIYTNDIGFYDVKYQDYVKKRPSTDAERKEFIIKLLEKEYNFDSRVNEGKEIFIQLMEGHIINTVHTGYGLCYNEYVERQ